MHPHPNQPPNRRPSLLTRLLAVAVLCTVMPIFALGATIAATGTVTVRVVEHDQGTNLWIPVPALLFDLAVVAVPRLVPPEDLAEARRDVEPYLPALRALSDELEAMPSATLVEVHGRDEHVRIAKVGSDFEITVEGDDANVRVSLPARLLGRSLDILD